MLVEIDVSTLRNINKISIKPISGINLFIGPNGSGKTSLLEAVHLLALGKSFRTRLLKTVIQLEQDAFQVTGKVQQQNIPVGLQFNNKTGLIMRFNNAPLKKLSDLAKQIPLQNIPANSHQFFEQGPRFKRQLLDWGLFHVEQGFNYHWLSFKKALQQRNAALKAKKADSEIVLWNESLVTHGEQLHSLRKKHLSEISEELIKIFRQLCPEFSQHKIEIKYSPGWPSEKSLSETLAEGLIRDRQLCYTRNGPHRADWTIKINGVDAANILSRGQQKLFFFALCFAQMKLKQVMGREGGILLIDDLSSELDDEHINFVVKQLAELPVQTFITATDNKIQQILTEASINNEVFHVKQGALL